jgi:2C-methyl-D-erythritol 2,4-cyclodiphosphate synthase
MERILSEVTSARVSVKATSNEGMGWIGRGEGIACIAVASVEAE